MGAVRVGPDGTPRVLHRGEWVDVPADHEARRSAPRRSEDVRLAMAAGCDRDADEAKADGDDARADQLRTRACRLRGEAVEIAEDRKRYRAPSGAERARHAAAFGRLPVTIVAQPPRRDRLLGGGRPRARRAAQRGSTRAGPGDDGGSEPPAAADLAPGRRRLTFGRFRRLTLGLAGGDRLVLFGTLPADAQDACWRDLERSCAEQIDRELEKARG